MTAYYWMPPLGPEPRPEPEPEPEVKPDHEPELLRQLKKLMQQSPSAWHFVDPRVQQELLQLICRKLRDRSPFFEQFCDHSDVPASTLPPEDLTFTDYKVKMKGAFHFKKTDFCLQEYCLLSCV